MPIPRKRFRKRKGGFRGPRPSSYMDKAQRGLYLAGKALAVAQGVRSIVNSEKKTYTKTVFNAVTVSSTGSMQEISSIAQGDDYTNRDGRSVLAKSLELKGWLNAHPSASTTMLRIIVFRDNNADGTDPVALDLLQSNTTYSLRNPDPTDMKRFSIYVDKLYMLDTQKSALAKVDIFRNLNHHIKFDASSGSNQGSLWVYVLSNLASNTPTVALTSRVRFYDN